jgi:hypothetical protein
MVGRGNLWCMAIVIASPAFGGLAMTMNISGSADLWNG